jgi:hypothetical protein
MKTTTSHSAAPVELLGFVAPIRRLVQTGASYTDGEDRCVIGPWGMPDPGHQTGARRRTYPHTASVMR